MTTKHTQGEMKASTTTLKTSNFADHVAHISIGPKVIGRINGGPTEEKAIALANAARLALCWNMHDEMAEALRDAATAAYSSHSSRQECQDLIVRLNASDWNEARKKASNNARAILAKLEPTK